MPDIHEVLLGDLQWIDDVVGYDNVSTVGAAYAQLLEFRKRIEEGNALRIHSPSPMDITSTKDFDDWVRARYPGFKDDPLHPRFCL